MPDSIIDNLNEQQKKAVLTTEGPVLILAGAGSGKTRVLTHRIAHLIYNNGIVPSSILAVTFTNKAAKEMLQRTSRLLDERNISFQRPTICTFHSFGVRVMRQHAELLEYSNTFSIIDSDDQKKIMREIFTELGVEYKSHSGSAVLSHISKAKSNFVTPYEFRQTVETSFDEIVNSMYPLYQKKLRSHQALDFDDLITLPVTLFQDHPQILKQYHDALQYFLIDEYQDTNKAQYTLTNLLASASRNLCVVGDDDQSIYSWRGADIRNILNFEKDYPDATIITLGQNYRSTKTILNAASDVIALNTARKKKDLWTDNGEGELIGYYEAYNESDEARFVSDRILHYCFKGINTHTYSDIAILYRTNAQSRVLEDNLRRSGIPYQIVGGTKFYERKEIKDLLAYFRLLFNPYDKLSFDRIINFPPRGIGEKALSFIYERFNQPHAGTMLDILQEVVQNPALSKQAAKGITSFLLIIKQLQEESTRSTLSSVFDSLCDKTGVISYYQDGSDEGEDRIQNMLELKNTLEEYSELPPDQALRTFLEEVALLSDIDKYHGEENQVTLITMHAVKGLEFPIVFLTGLEEGLFPHSRSSQDYKELEEERRLCYVAITRAKEKLYLTRAKERMVYGTYQHSVSSQFLEVISQELIRPLHIPDWGMAGTVTQVTKTIPMKQQDGFKVTQALYKDGDKVAHNTFGEGVIVQTKGDEIVVAFKTVGIKHLLASMAPLTKVS